MDSGRDYPDDTNQHPGKLLNYNSGIAGSATVKEPAEIEQELEYIEKNIELLSMAADGIINRIDPILSTVYPEPSDPNVKENPRESGLGNKLFRLNCSLADIRDRLNSANDRIRI